MTLPSTNSLTLLFALANRMPDRLTDSNKATLNTIYHDCLENLDDPDALFAYTIAKAMRTWSDPGNRQPTSMHRLHSIIFNGTVGAKRYLVT